MKLIEQLREQRKTVLADVDAINAASEAREDKSITDEELTTLTAKRGEADALTQRIEDLVADEKRAEAAIEADQSADKRTERKVESTREARTYNEGGAVSFFGDVYRSRANGDPGAQARLGRHMEEVRVHNESVESRDVGTSNVGGLVVPQYLVDEFAGILRAGRATANVVRNVPLPDQGTAFVIPRGNTGTAVAPQATQNTAVQNTDLDFNNDLTVNLKTFAGQQNVSRQTLERGTPGVDQLIYADLVADYAKKLDVSIIKDDGTSGTHKGLLSATGTNGVTYTQASPTAANFWPKLADAYQRVGANRFLPADVVIMHPRRWGWLLSQVDGNNRPLFISDPSGALNAMGADNANLADGQAVGFAMGLPVIVDANIPINLGGGTNEDRVFVARRSDPILWEDGDGMPRELRFEDVLGANLTVKLVVYGYSAFTAERYATAVSIISGTGLVTPTF